MIEIQSLQKKPDKIILMIGILAAVLLPLVAAMVVAPMKGPILEKVFYSRFIYWGTVLCLLFYARVVERQPLLIWAEKNNGIVFFLVSVFILYLLFIAAGIVSSIPAWFGLHEKNEVLKKIVRILKGHTALIFFISLTAGVTEELIFRGYLLTRLAQLFKGPYIPVIGSALVFAAMHYSYKSVHELIFVFLIGIIYGTYYNKYRNIKVLMLSHFLIDFINVMLLQHYKI